MVGEAIGHEHAAGVGVLVQPREPAVQLAQDASPPDNLQLEVLWP